MEGEGWMGESRPRRWCSRVFWAVVDECVMVMRWLEKQQ
jgi:hypothetical protein